MKTKDSHVILAAVVIIPLMLAVSVRLWIMTGYPRGEYSEVPSPGGRHKAYLTVKEDLEFFGGLRRYYTFEVEMGLTSGRTKVIYKEDFEEEDLSRPFDLDKLRESIHWSTDASEVKLDLGWKEIEYVVPF